MITNNRHWLPGQCNYIVKEKMNDIFFERIENVGNREIISYCSETGIEIQDVFKYLYQSCLGCEHLVSDYFAVFDKICSEMKYADNDDLPDIEILDGDYCRVHLKVLNDGLSPESLCKLFMLSAENNPNGLLQLERKLCNLILLAGSGDIPFSENTVKEKINEWKNNNYPAIHHSDKYNEAHHPSYRVIRKEFLRYLPLLKKIDILLQSKKNKVIVALDGRCASGKTTTAYWLAKIYDCNVFHMDDFFLRPEQRTQKRLSIPGENVDHERFLNEVLQPLSEGKDILYRKYDCSSQSLGPVIDIPSKRFNIVEGSYSLHPELIGYYDLSVFSDVSKTEQRRRILKRDSSEMFFSKWIPLEERYFSEFQIYKKADMIL